MPTSFLFYTGNPAINADSFNDGIEFSLVYSTLGFNDPIDTLSHLMVTKLESSKDWYEWKDDIKECLVSENLWGIVQGNFYLADDATPEKQHEYWKIRCIAARAIRATCDSEAAQYIEDTDDPTEMLAILERWYKPKDSSVLLEVTKKLGNCRQTGTVDEYTTQFQGIVIELDRIQCSLPPSVIVGMYLAGLGPALDEFVGDFTQTRVIHSEDSAKIVSLSEAAACARDAEAQTSSSSQDFIANTVSTRGHNANQPFGGNGDKLLADCCTKCHRPGHLQHECKTVIRRRIARKRRRDRAKGNSNRIKREDNEVRYIED